MLYWIESTYREFLDMGAPKIHNHCLSKTQTQSFIIPKHFSTTHGICVYGGKAEDDRCCCKTTQPTVKLIY